MSDAPPGATQDVTTAARDALKKVQDLIEENQKSIKSALENLDKFTATLARNSDHVDNTLASIDKFTGALGRTMELVVSLDGTCNASTPDVDEQPARQSAASTKLTTPIIRI